ncbi:serine/threonine-protein kinase PLK4-like protein [Leptotrombidium deliense]|uniref:Serine/threonine-protein kinase PLK4-like protein n=1 Tax=Leptotrombidium deliense TaxID=299467 RepID=A0A443S8K8_9ACAR|nr:serine/threonine-protein kinase PLK4-like protein [Leptotrombidium deliense]
MDSNCDEEEFGESINEYELRKEIGVGSFGRVFEAVCITNKKQCAVKVIDIRKANLDKVDRINAEISVHLRLKHENICELYAVFQDSLNVYLVLELCWGTLSDFLKMAIDYNHTALRPNINILNVNSDSQLTKHRHSVKKSGDIIKTAFTKHILPFATIRRIIKQICTGLHYLHRNNIIHRDLNLKNVLLKLNPFEKQDFIVKIADFGLAFDTKYDHVPRDIFKRFPKGKTICGTPGYISPEVWSQDGVSTASDVFSVGSLLYALVTGVTPRGELDLHGMHPFLSDLIGKLLKSEPSKRITVDDVMSHPLIVGHLLTTRLSPICKLTKSLQLMLTEEGDVKILFLKSHSTIEVSGVNDKVVVCSKNKSSTFTLESLPECHWKKLIYVWRFVDLLKSRNAKVIFHLHENNIVRCAIRGNLTVVKCCLMENNTFEVTFLNTRSEKFTLNSQLLKSRDDERLMALVKKYRENCIEIEQRMKKFEDESGVNSFPVIIGKKPKHKNLGGGYTSDFSITVDGIGSVSLKSDGVFKVQFHDGSIITTGDKTPITFQSPVGETKRFKSNDVLPKYVLQKLALVPKAIEELRKKSLLKS